MSNAERYVAVTGDLVGSSRLPSNERRALQARVARAAADFGRAFMDGLIVPFTIGGGDEFQGMLDDLAATVEVISFWRSRLHPHGARFGIGVGPVDTEVGASTSAMDGECLRRSRAAVTAAKRDEVFAYYDTGCDVIDTAVNAILRLVAAVQADWGELHFRRFWLYTELGDLQKVADREGTTKQAISQSLSRAGYRGVLRAEQDVQGLLERLWASSDLGKAS